MSADWKNDWRSLSQKHLGEQRIQAVYFLTFLYECVILGNTAQCQFLHQVDLVSIAHVAVLGTIGKVSLIENRALATIHSP